MKRCRLEHRLRRYLFQIGCAVLPRYGIEISGSEDKALLCASYVDVCRRVLSVVLRLWRNGRRPHLTTDCASSSSSETSPYVERALKRFVPMPVRRPDRVLNRRGVPVRTFEGEFRTMYVFPTRIAIIS